jgi:hypothetical protein
MRLVYLPLLPVPVLAVVVAFAACSAPHSAEPPARVVPPALALSATPSPTQGPAAAPAGGPVQDEPPTADDVAAFERHVAK